jgi:hypothetical protein
MPIGMATHAVTSMTRIEPTQADRIPALAARRDGKLVKNSVLKRGRPSIAMSTIKASSVATPTIREVMPTMMKMTSHRLCLWMTARRTSGDLFI